MQQSIFFAAYVDELCGATRRWGQTQNYKHLNMFRLDLCAVVDPENFGGRR